MSLENPIFCFPHHFPHTGHLAHDSVLWIGQKRNEPLWQCPAQPGKQAAHSLALFYPTGEIMGQGKSLPTLSCALLWGKLTQVKLNFPLFPLTHPNSLFVWLVGWLVLFLAKTALDYLFWKPGLPERLSFLWVIV